MLSKLLVLLSLISIYPTAGQEKHSLFSEILQDYVHNGLVDYSNLKNDTRLDEYLTDLSIANPDTIKNKNDRLAFWINAYNAYTLKIIADEYPIESINELHTGGLIIGHILGATVWDKDIVTINNKKVSLNFIEHGVIRKKFNEPRIHFALVCASISCPNLRAEAFEGFKLDQQLFEESKKFFNDKTKNEFNVSEKEVELSKIMDWYDDDFGGNEKEILVFISKYLSEELAGKILQNPEAWNISYKSYNWDLNDHFKQNE